MTTDEQRETGNGVLRMIWIIQDAHDARCYVVVTAIACREREVTVAVDKRSGQTATVRATVDPTGSGKSGIVSGNGYRCRSY